MKNFLSAVRLILTLKCEHSTHLVSDGFDRDLTFSERWAVRLHAMVCLSCRRFGKQIRLLKGMLQVHPERTDDATKLSPEALARIRRAIDSENPPR